MSEKCYVIANFKHFFKEKIQHAISYSKEQRETTFKIEKSLEVKNDNLKNVEEIEKLEQLKDLDTLGICSRQLKSLSGLESLIAQAIAIITGMIRKISSNST